MAERPVFIPAPDAPGFVKEKSLVIRWAGGFSVVQKKKNIKALHNAAESIGIAPVLEASTKSDEKIGQHLSAFSLKVMTVDGNIPLECAFQGSKVFENGGPYTDLYFVDARSAKRDPRLHDSGKLVAFVFEGHKFPLEPKTAFYDWLYISAIFPHRDWLDRLSRYAAFSDIEFNPQKSINCQARSLALFVSLKARHLLDEAVSSPESFIEIMHRAVRQPVGAAREAATTGANSASVQPPEAIAVTEGTTGPFQKVMAEPPQAVAYVPELRDEALGEATPPPSTVVSAAKALDRVTRVPSPDPKSPAPDFETFLRERTLRKPQNPHRTRRKQKAAKAKRDEG